MGRWLAQCRTSRCFFRQLPDTIARTPHSIRQDPAEFAGPLERDFKGTRIGWVGDFGGQIPFDPGVLELCEASLKVFETLGCSVETAALDYPLERVWQSWLTIRGWQIAAEFRASYPDPAQRALMKPELQWEIENGLKTTAMEVAIASRTRTAWYHAVRKFFEKYDFMIAPAAQVFPFDAITHWPKEVGGVSMDTYHRWMHVMIPISMSGCPALSVPGRLQPTRIANGHPDSRPKSRRDGVHATRARLRSSNQLGDAAAAVVTK